VADEEFSGVGQVTISLGLCTSTDAADIAAVVDGADQALYEAKRAGRNRTADRHRAATSTPPRTV
jgi:PleD family two-component response regulator